MHDWSLRSVTMSVQYTLCTSISRNRCVICLYFNKSNSIAFLIGALNHLDRPIVGTDMVIKADRVCRWCFRAVFVQGNQPEPDMFTMGWHLWAFILEKFSSHNCFLANLSSVGGSLWNHTYISWFARSHVLTIFKRQVLWDMTGSYGGWERLKHSNYVLDRVQVVHMRLI